MKKHQFGFKFFVIVLSMLVLAGCKSSKSRPSYSKHRPPSNKKTYRKPSGTTSSGGSLANASPSVKKVIQKAKSYTGTKYKYGGTTKSGMDCSGLMYVSFKSIDKSIPRTSSAQSTIGKRVYIAQLVPGDLIFFATGSNKSKITHVGMITEVKGKNDVRFIHASSSRGVVEDNVFADYYRSRYVKAVRPF